jgi:zinc protease
MLCIKNMQNVIKICLAIFILFIVPCILWAKPILNIKTWRSDNGIPVYFVAARQNPMLDIEVLVDAGSKDDGAKFGVASLVSAMLDQGAGDMSVNQIAASFANIGAIYGADTNKDTANISLRTLTQKAYLAKAIKLFNLVITKPTFPEPELTRLKNQTKAALTLQKQNPANVAMLTFYKTLYENLPYAHNELGTVNTINDITKNDVNKFYKHFYTTQNIKVIMVGDLSLQAAHDVANKVTVGIPTKKLSDSIRACGEHAKTESYDAIAQDVTSYTKPTSSHDQIQKVNFPGTQSYIVLGTKGIKHSNPNYFPLVLGNHILGGGILVSRLFNNIREQEGLSYSIGSRFIILKNRGPFLISLQTKNTTVPKAMKITHKVLNDFIRNGPTAKELKGAKKNILGSFALSFAGNTKILAALRLLAIYDLPIDYFSQYQANINGVTTAQIKDAFQQVLGSQRFITVIVGS